MTSILVYSQGEVIGDGLIKLPLMASLRSAWPEAQIVWGVAGETVYSTVLRPIAFQMIDDVIDGLEASLQLPGVLWTRPLEGRHFDKVLDTQAQVLRSFCVRRIRHSDYRGMAFGADDGDAGSNKKQRIIDRLLTLGGALGRPLNPAPVPQAPGEWEEVAKVLLPDGPDYVGLAPGAGGREKCWPAENYIALAQELTAQGRVPVFLLGPDEKDWLERFRSAVPAALFPEWERRDSHQDLKGPCLVIALASRLKAAVANDSGTGHMLAAGGAPLVSLFSSGRHLEKFRPTVARGITIDATAVAGSLADLEIGPVAAALNDLLERA